jgi:aryl-alcohol dehydrogenase-like predicted oxidoreductase
VQTRKLGYTDLRLTTIGFGSWAVGGPWRFGWGPQDDAESIAAIHRALELGINWIDTAPAYGLGHSEEVVAKAIQGRRESVIVATKLGRVWDDASAKEGRVFGSLKAHSVRRECENSLRRLNVDVIDLYQVHWPDPDAELEEGWTELARLVEEGKIRYVGASNFSVSQLERVGRIHPVASLQPPYNMLRRDVENELLAHCAAHEIGVVVYSPMASGMLTGKYTAEQVSGLDNGDWRKKSAEFTEPHLSANLALIERLRPLAAKQGHDVAQLAIAWTLRRPEVTAAIVGARRPSQVDDVAAAAGWTLSSAELAEIDAALAARTQAI